MQKKVKLTACCFFIWSVCFTAFTSHAHDVTTEVGSHLGAAKAGSKVLKSKKKERRFVPVPIPISNPTIGTGLGFGLLYLWPQKEDTPVSSPTSMSGVGGLYTSSSSWAAALFHEGYYAEDRFRLTGALGYGDFNLDFFGIGNDSIFRDNPLEYEIAGIFFDPQARFQLPFISKDLFLGVKLFYLDLDVTFKLSGILPGLPDPDLGEKTVGLGPILTYDSRDNVQWPSKGNWLDVTVLDFDDKLGSDFDYQQYTLKWEQNFTLTDSTVLQYRFDSQYVDGFAPFYELPYINLRGFPRGLYVGDLAMTLQGQIRWEVAKKWTVMFFGGGGRVGDDLSDLGKNSTEFAGGTGFRYMIDSKSKLTIGADFAFGGFDSVVFYIEIGDFLSQ
jgi:hypothetical protein